ncbi:MAG: 3-dehydroquinate synthase [Rhodobiaceae bacterium]|nr:3-dehydroquinate synthase [Rhodobiaceae bacterium]
MTSLTAEKVTVDLGDRAYNILVGPDLIANAGTHIAPLLKRGRVVIVTDENVADRHLATLEKSLTAADITSQAFVLPAGEKTKNFEQLQSLLSDLLDAGVERGDLIIALGGGVIGDLTGFAASVLRRGVDFAQIPTSLLAQVDSSVGGKTGINVPQGKNLIGAFHQPRLVLADISALKTLPPRELRAGYAEVVKYGLIDDAPFFNWLEANVEKLMAGDPQALTQAIVKSCQSKARIVAQDEREGGVRALLNLGHTFGHALEAATGFSDRLIHGEGVAVGMVLAFNLSAKLGLCSGQDATRAARHLEAAGLPTKLSDIPGDLPSADRLIELMGQDKKVVDGTLTFILAKSIGGAFITRDVSASDLLEFMTDQKAV